MRQDQCEVPYCIEPVSAADLCTAHLVEFKEWLRRKAWREANGVKRG